MADTTITFDDFMDGRTEEASPAGSDKAITKKVGVTAKKTSAGNLITSSNPGSATKAASYTILDADTEGVFYLSGAGGNSIFTLPTLADNLDKEFLFINLDSTYELQIKGEGAENLSHLGITQNTIDVELEGSGIKVKAGATNWEVIGVEGAKLKSISGTLEIIYEEYFTGTTDADATTVVTHNENVAKILHVSGQISDGTSYGVSDYLLALSATIAFQIYIDATNITLGGVGANCQSQPYKIKMEYYL